MPPIPPITQFLMLACTAVFCIQVVSPAATSLFILYPLTSVAFWPWQLLTYAFLHADMLHLFFNMLGLWMFGGELEQLWGRKRYAIFIAVGALFGAVTFLVITLLMGVRASLVGFSGAVYALLIAAAMYYPNRIIMPLFPPIPMKMKVFVAVFGALSLLIGLSGGDLGSLAHLGGMIGGWLTIRFWRGLPPFGRARR